MSEFATVATVLPAEPRGSKAIKRLHDAYIAFVAGRPSVEDCQLIMVDLANFSGYYNTTSPNASDAALRYSEGQRSVFGRVMIMSNPALSIVDAIQRAVQEEMKTDETGY